MIRRTSEPIVSLYPNLSGAQTNTSTRHSYVEIAGYIYSICIEVGGYLYSIYCNPLLFRLSLHILSICCPKQWMICLSTEQLHLKVFFNAFFSFILLPANPNHLALWNISGIQSSCCHVILPPPLVLIPGLDDWESLAVGLLPSRLAPSNPSTTMLKRDGSKI